MVKALILNSGTGSRMGAVTRNNPKCMTRLATGETILCRQLRQLAEAEIWNVVITTGAHDKDIREHCLPLNASMRLSFVLNDRYADTNYIYSMHLARGMIDSDVLLLHGDLVFQDDVLRMMLEQRESCMAVSSATAPLPPKDFKAVLNDGRICKIGVDFFENAVAASPLYKLRHEDWRVWSDAIKKFCDAGKRSCYAEDAFNALDRPFPLFPLDAGTLLCSEIDTREDLLAVNLRLKQLEKNGLEQ